MFTRIVNRVLGMIGRASRIDLDAGAARDFDLPPQTPPSRPTLRVIEGGLARPGRVEIGTKSPHRHAS